MHVLLQYLVLFSNLDPQFQVYLFGDIDWLG